MSLEKYKTNQILFSFYLQVKVYLGTHDITNNPSRESGIYIKSLWILKEVNIVVLHSKVRMVEKLLEEPSYFYRLKEIKVPLPET